MSNSEEKIKAFFNDQEKMQALISDETFIGKISDGTATNETYAEKFKELGLDLSESESKEIAETVTKLLSAPSSKLGELELDNVSGGITKETKQKVMNIGDFAFSAGGVGSMACMIGSLACQITSSRAITNGNKTKGKEYKKAAKGLRAAAYTLAGISLTGGAASFGVRHILD